MDWTANYHALMEDTMPKKKGELRTPTPYNQQGKEGTYPWKWRWDVPTSKGTGTPYVVSVRENVNGANFAPIWGCNCAAGKNNNPLCQHRQRVQYDIVTAPNMLRNLPSHIRSLVAPNLNVVQSNLAAGDRGIQPEGTRGLKVVL